MSTTHFTHDDIARTRLSPATNPMIEALFALDFLLCDPGRARPGGWVRHARARLAETASIRSELERAAGLAAELMPFLQDSAASPGVRDTTGWPPALRGPMATLVEVQRSCVAPYWSSVRGLQAQAGRRVHRLIAEHGIAAALETAGERVRWSGGVLTLDDGADRTVFLGGRGAILLPSVFLSGGPRFFSWPEPGTGRATGVLAFSVCPHGRAAGALTKEDEDVPETLARLLGRTRAAVLAALTRARSTGGLSRELNISATTVSEHTSVLRGAGLITTTRRSNSVRHLVTPLGMTVLHSPGEQQEQWCGECAYRNTPLARSA
ncbi:ArsR/SmtB family transcription factor [Nocardiopsis ansamitocini]|uniref:HTH arsR-type domain-containing protein n=1 Tax=Nocardiopsis ansamitocini TaxID=1670832 RepID=A0A9W6UKF9_9ACTN|nr:helix-turn-helix domain-containing protein [Nocardiopsis ansamitocini]GLU49548.1 hypothetical protein Nans01_38990 [Nocardiopsis ansamitocini]